MLKIDRYALECDLAETYHIFDIKALPLRKVALFSYGLRENSRIKMKMNGMSNSLETQFLASMLDQLRLLVWSKTEDAQHGVNRPESILLALLGRTEKKTNNNIIVFDSTEEFEKARRKFIKGE